MKRKLIIMIVLLISLTSFGVIAQMKPAEIRSKYKEHKAVPDRMNKLGIYVEGVTKQEAGGYTVELFFNASMPQGNMLLLDPMRDDKIILPKIFLLDAVNPTEEIPAKAEKIMFIDSSHALGTFPIQGFGAVVRFETSLRYILLCFEGITQEKVKPCATPPLFYMIDLHAKKKNLLDKKAYYLNELKRPE